MEEAVTTAPEAEGKVNTVASVPAKVKELLAVKVLPPPIVRVPVEEVMVKPFIEVAVAAPMLGVVKVGELAKTIAPVPVVALPKTVTVPEVLKVATTPSMPAKVRVLLTVKVSPEPIVKVPVVEVIVKPLYVLLVSAWLASRVATVPEATGKVKTVLSIPEKVSEELAVRVLPPPIVRVPVEEVMVRPFKEVTDGVVVTVRVTFPVKAPPPVKLAPAMTCVELETLLLNIVQSAEERNPD